MAMKKKPIDAEIAQPPKKLFEIQHPDDIDTTREVLKVNRGIYLMEDWWREQHLTVHYDINDYNQYYLSGLEELDLYIRRFHEILAPQQELSNRMLVFGVGATQLLNAAIYALSVLHSQRSSEHKGFLKTSLLYFTHQTPGYLDTKGVIEAFNEFSVKWIPVEKHKLIDKKDLVELVTSPNNPDGRILRPVTKAQHIIYDRVNWWQCYLTNNQAVYSAATLENDEISIWSLPKVLSFSGSRVGYAFVKDARVARYMRHFVIISTHGITVDGQIRCLTALKYLVDNNKAQEYMDWLSSKLIERWNLITPELEKNGIKVLNDSGPCVWLQTKSNAQKFLLQKFNVIGTYGPEYGVDETYARLNLLCTTNQFNELLSRLKS